MNEWIKSSFCSAGQCVEVSWQQSSFCSGTTCVDVAHSSGEVLVRDPKNPNQQPLVFTPDEWAAFVQGVKACEFDAPQGGQ